MPKQQNSTRTKRGSSNSFCGSRIVLYAGSMAILPVEPGLASFSLDSPSPYILFNTIPPTHHVLLRQDSDKGRWWRKRSLEGKQKVHSMRGNWCTDFKVWCPSCHQSVLKTSTGTHHFFQCCCPWRKSLSSRTTLQVRVLKLQVLVLVLRPKVLVLVLEARTLSSWLQHCFLQLPTVHNSNRKSSSSSL